MGSEDFLDENAKACRSRMAFSRFFVAFAALLAYNKKIDGRIPQKKTVKLFFKEREGSMEALDAQQTILLVESEETGLAALREILGGEYTLVCARDGTQARALLNERHGDFAAVVLDLAAPAAGGREFLRRKALCPEEANLPVLAAIQAEESAFAEETCLALGAWDFVRKPYQARTVQLRLENIIARSRQSLYRQLVYVSERDPLTGLLNQRAFLTEIGHLLHKAAETAEAHFTLLRIDINRFGLINSLYGPSEGDALLCHIGKAIACAAADFTHAPCGRIYADVFCLLVPCEDAALQALLKNLQKSVAAYPAHYYLEMTIGVYPISDPTLDPRVIYRRAALAAATCKNNYQNHIAFYDEKLSRIQHEEQEIANEMEAALANGQFVVYLQPKFDMETERPCGAEALVRWNHPTRGQIPPDAFVPVFERNGFIPLLDRFMWEQVCILLRRWLDAGQKPCPVSVNVSRQNLYNPHLVQQLLALVRKYNIPPSLMQLELTESAYMDAPARMGQTVQRLRRSGFTLLMDDFGSKYSSLNALKDMPVDILKLDLGFLAPGPNKARGRCILEAMLHMAQKLELPTVVEGVETAEQKRFLQSVGARYAQGFYFARPLSVPDYEALMAQNQ